MKNKLDISWFNLKNYEGLSGLDLSSWHWQLEIRRLLNDLSSLSSDKEWLKDEGVLHWIDCIKNNPILDDDNSYWGRWRESYSAYPFNTYSVYSTPALYAYGFRETPGLVDFVTSRKVCDAIEQGIPIYTPYDFVNGESGVGVDFTNVTVDLTATDDRIKQDFSHWLTEYRKATGYTFKKEIPALKNKLAIELNIKDWIKFRLLPYIDLRVSPINLRAWPHSSSHRLNFFHESIERVKAI